MYIIEFISCTDLLHSSTHCTMYTSWPWSYGTYM